MMNKSLADEELMDKEEKSTDPGDLKITLHYTDGAVDTWITSLVHLAEKSPYFATLIHFKEGNDRAVEIKNIDHEGMRHILKRHNKRLEDYQNISKLSSVRNLIHAYAVADRLMFDCYQEKALRGVMRLSLYKSITTADLLYSKELGIPFGSSLMQYLLARVGWLWSYTDMGNFQSPEPDALILQGSELAWELLNKFWQAHRHFRHGERPNMYDSTKNRIILPSTGISRLISLQKQRKPVDDQMRLHMCYTIRQLEDPDRSHRLDVNFKPFIINGGPLVWSFVKRYVASSRCHLRRVIRATKSPFIEPTFWHICNYHAFVQQLTVNPKWQERCECLESRIIQIEWAMPKIGQC